MAAFSSPIPSTKLGWINATLVRPCTPSTDAALSAAHLPYMASLPGPAFLGHGSTLTVLSDQPNIACCPHPMQQSMDGFRPPRRNYMRTLAPATLSLLLAILSADAAAQAASGSAASTPVNSGSQSPTRAAVKAETAKGEKAGSLPVDQYDQSPSAPARTASSPGFHLRHRKAAASAAH